MHSMLTVLSEADYEKWLKAQAAGESVESRVRALLGARKECLQLFAGPIQPARKRKTPEERPDGGHTN